jgi:HlyD family secretion protein
MFLKIDSKWGRRFSGVALAAGVAWLSGCSERAPAAWSGYAEGDYVYVAAPLAGQLKQVSVVAGQTVALGAPLFALDAESEQAARDQAAALVAAAQAQANNVAKGKRPQELKVSDAQLAQAQASAALARQDLNRQRQLLAQGFVSKARIDDAEVALRQAQARVDELGSALGVARLPARDDERTAAQANATAATEALRQADWRLAQKQQAAPVAGLVAEVFYQLGELVAAGQPVVSLLPPGNVKARFYVPEAELSTIRPGQSVALHCDACPAPIGAHITRVATSPEFTPPVIYSNAQRAKLVYMVEAQPDVAPGASPVGQPGAGAPFALKPGQPLDVRPVAGGAAP